MGFFCLDPASYEVLASLAAFWDPSCPSTTLCCPDTYLFPLAWKGSGFRPFYSTTVPSARLLEAFLIPILVGPQSQPCPLCAVTECGHSSVLVGTQADLQQPTQVLTPGSCFSIDRPNRVKSGFAHTLRVHSLYECSCVVLTQPQGRLYFTPGNRLGGVSGETCRGHPKPLGYLKLQQVQLCQA